MAAIQASPAACSARPAAMIAVPPNPCETRPEYGAGQVEPAFGAVGLLQPHQRERDQDQPEGDVEPEDPLPGDALNDRAADQRAERDGEAADAAPGAEREAAALCRHRRRENRQR